MGPYHRDRLIRHPLIPTHEGHALQVALCTQLHHVVREQSGYIIYRDIRRGHTGLLHQGQEERPQ